MMTEKELRTFKKLFSKYCRQEISKGHCEEDCCDICPVNNAYDEIFNRFADDKDDDSLEENWEEEDWME